MISTTESQNELVLRAVEEALKERRAIHDNLKAVQGRCTELLEEVRVYRKLLAMVTTTATMSEFIALQDQIRRVL